MSNPFEPDELMENGIRYVYRGRVWTSDAGMRLSLAQSQNMTMRFYALHGRPPAVEPAKPVRRPSRRPSAPPEDKKAAALRAAIAKAAAAKQSGGSYR